MCVHACMYCISSGSAGYVTRSDYNHGTFFFIGGSFKIVPSVEPLVRTCHCKARVVCVTGFPARAAGTAGSKLSVKLAHAACNPPPHRWAGPEQPALWTDVLAEMSRHIYIRNKLGEGIQAPIFQVPCVTYKLISKKSLQNMFCSLCRFLTKASHTSVVSFARNSAAII